MSDNGNQRRLSAILAADMVGYTRRMEQDTDGTVAAWKEARSDIIDPAISEHSGRIVKHTGDGFLAEFPTVLDAVNCANGIQSAMTNSILDFRIGINLSDIIDDGEDIHGEGVNIAARIEALAEPGGICVSGGVYDQVRNRLDRPFEDTGEHQVKHVTRPIRVFRVLGEGETPKQPTQSSRPVVNYILPALVGLIIIASTSIWWWQLPPDPAKIADEHPSTSSIAVLPFTNLSEDKAQAYFADGITEDIITDLSKISGLYVTSRGATLRYRKEVGDPRNIGTELGVRHILEGSVRRAGGRVRITTKLIDAKTGGQLWAERFDRDTQDIFAIQDEIADRVVAQLSVRLKEGSLKRAARTYTPNLEAYDLYIQGRAKRIPPTPGNLAAALKMFENAIKIDPKFAGGYAGASYVHGLRYSSTPVHIASSADHLEKSLQLAEKAVNLDPAFGPAWGSLTEAYVRKRRFSEALRAIKKAMDAAPNDSLMRATYGRLLGHIGQPAEGIEQVRKAMRMSPDSLPMLYFESDPISLDTELA